MKIEHIAIWTMDLEGLKEFYVKYFNAKAGNIFINEKTGFRSYFLTFDEACRLEIMEKPKVSGQKEPAFDVVGLAHVSLFGAEIKRAYKLLKVYPLDTINSIISFVIMSVVFMIGINAVGDSTQIFGVVFFPLMLNLIGGPSSSIRNDIEMGVFEQVYISKFSLIKVAIIRSIVAGLSSVVGSVLIGIILHLFFVKITIPFYHLLLLFVLFSIQGLLIGVILAGITLRFRKTETLLNTLNILLMILIVLPLASVSDLFWHIPSLLCPLWGIVTYYQQLLTDPYSPVVLWNLLVVVVNTGFLAFVARAFYNKLLNTTKIKGFLGQY